MGIPYQVVVENGLLSPEVLDCIPETCECGAPIEFTESLRQIYCTNPRCPYKVAARLESMAKKMKADGWGESTCITVVKEFGMISPYQVFLLEKKLAEGKRSTVPAYEKKVASICDREKRKVRLWEVVALGGIPNVETVAYKIFDGYNSLKEAFEDIEKGGVPFIAEKLGVKNSEGSVMAANIYKTLMEYKDELLFGETQFEIIKPEGVKLHIAITGGVMGFRNKAEFVNYINNRYAGKVNAMLMNSVTNNVDILVADGDTNSNKFRTATKINSKYIEEGLKKGLFTREEIGQYKSEKDLRKIGEKIVIGTSKEIIQRLDRVFGD